MPHKSANPEKTSAKSKSAAARNVIGARKDTRKDKGNGLDREGMISVAAYFRAEHRGFGGGDTLTDWLAAEAEIDEMLVSKGSKAH